ncbi:hypothetical protein ACH518_16385 [Methylomonas sp. HW2-6]|uniref:hypothetical protein n=1 Tax=Methylomonas TaxID=416 RepID=UPI00112CF0F2|nr:hypothetical protein [Methylomonas koyamae]TPQ26516.1 hypothetical protein C2U68_11615 [Methylomonas koyamae]
MLGSSGAFAVEHLKIDCIYMRFFGLVVLLTCFISIGHAETTKSGIPAELEIQIKKLTELLSDSYGSSPSKSWEVQAISLNSIAVNFLAIFTLEGYTGGNGWTQYLAVFEFGEGENGKPDSYPLVDFMPVGGKGCRTIPKLDVKTTYLNTHGDKVFTLDVLENTENDAPNFPTRKSTADITLKNGRLTEQNQKCQGAWD